MASQSKTKKKNIPKSVNEMSKEMLQETLRKKKECNAKALQTVEKLCEEEVNEEWFLENLQFINQTHFEDATVERAITKLCGYPLCCQKLEKIPTQQYHISTRYNKVFDITERKNFCSSSCYKAALYVKNQLFTSPLWFRDQEVIPKYTVLKASVPTVSEDVDKINKQPDEISVSELEEKYSKLAVNSDLEKDAKQNDNCTCNTSESKKEKVDRTIENSFSDPGTKFHKPSEIDKSNSKVKLKTKQENPVQKIEKCFFEWFSLDSLFYLFREEKIKELFHDDSTKLKQALESKLKMANYGAKIDRMIQLYGLLDGTSINSGVKTTLKPLPDYSALKEEGKMIEIKVKAFYHGQLEVKPDKKPEAEEENKEKPDEDNNIYLPLVDAHSQLALRRKIMLEKVNKVVPDLIRVFSTEYILQTADVRNLISTFALTAHNITFKPNEWILVGLILMKLLSLKDKPLESILMHESSQTQLVSLLRNYELQESYLETFINRLTDSTNIMQKFHEINK